MKSWLISVQTATCLTIENMLMFWTFCHNEWIFPCIITILTNQLNWDRFTPETRPVRSCLHNTWWNFCNFCIECWYSDWYLQCLKCHFKTLSEKMAQLCGASPSNEILAFFRLNWGVKLPSYLMWLVSWLIWAVISSLIKCLPDSPT